MKQFISFLSILLLSLTASAQYWFGPKFGLSLIDHIYQDSEFETDTTFRVPLNFNFQAGFAVSYTATGMYSVYGEIMYERIGRTVRDQETNGALYYSSITNHFITVPMMLRVTLGTDPIHFYLNGGPRLSYWVTGSGTILPNTDAFQEFAPAGRDENGNPLPIDVKFRFNSDAASPGNFSNAYIDKPNRLQFGLTFGGGTMFDIAGGGRLQLDLRMSWVHSSMATASSKDVNLGEDPYVENLEYYHTIGSASIAYMWGYNANLRRKGRSTSKESNKKKKK